MTDLSYIFLKHKDTKKVENFFEYKFSQKFIFKIIRSIPENIIMLIIFKIIIVLLASHSNAGKFIVLIIVYAKKNNLK